MRLKQDHKASKTSHVTPVMASTLRNYADEPAVNHPLWPLFCAIVDAMDEAAVSDDTCVIVGTTRSRTSYSVTFKVRGNVATCYGADVDELMAAIDDTYQPG